MFDDIGTDSREVFDECVQLFAIEVQRLVVGPNVTPVVVLAVIDTRNVTAIAETDLRVERNTS